MPRRRRVEGTYLLAAGERLSGSTHYCVEGHIGSGAFAAAYRARDDHGETCFIKEYFPPERPSRKAELTQVYARERDVVRRIGNYELTPRFRDAFEQEGFHYLVTDYIPGLDLETVVRSGQKPDTETVLRWCVCLCQELSFLHSRNVVHHDLKPANIRLNESGDPVIVDFSAAHWYRRPGEKTDMLFGSDSYLAPEHLERGEEDEAMGKQMDVFALGRIFVELMVGERLTQEDINRRHDQLYGKILHDGKLDVSFVRAVFRSVAYDPQRRYPSGVELAEDITPAAPPVGRVRPFAVDFGLVTDTAPKEVILQAFNVGGGTLRAELAVDADWLEIATSTNTTARNLMFERNRQAVRMIAYPERIPPGSQVSGRIAFTFQNQIIEVPVHLRRPSAAADISVSASSVKIGVPPGGFGNARLVFQNSGGAPAEIRLVSPPDFTLGLSPDLFVLGAGERREVTISVDSGVLGDAEAKTQVNWQVDGNERPAIPVRASVKRSAGLISAISGRFRKG